jgi:hypothetical protein
MSNIIDRLEERVKAHEKGVKVAIGPNGRKAHEEAIATLNEAIGLIKLYQDKLAIGDLAFLIVNAKDLQNILDEYITDDLRARIVLILAEIRAKQTASTHTDDDEVDARIAAYKAANGLE